MYVCVCLSTHTCTYTCRSLVHVCLVFIVPSTLLVKTNPSAFKEDPFSLLADQQFARPQGLPLPRSSSTPSTSTPRKRVVTTTVTTRQQTRQTYSNDTGNSVKQTDSVETVSVKKKSPPAKEEKSICGPHIQILLAVVVFLVFTVFLIYHLMDENPNNRIE